MSRVVGWIDGALSWFPPRPPSPLLNPNWPAPLPPPVAFRKRQKSPLPLPAPRPFCRRRRGAVASAAAAPAASHFLTFAPFGPQLNKANQELIVSPPTSKGRPARPASTARTGAGRGRAGQRQSGTEGWRSWHFVKAKGEGGWGLREARVGALNVCVIEGVEGGGSKGRRGCPGRTRIVTFHSSGEVLRAVGRAEVRETPRPTHTLLSSTFALPCPAPTVWVAELFSHLTSPCFFPRRCRNPTRGDTIDERTRGGQQKSPAHIAR